MTNQYELKKKLGYEEVFELADTYTATATVSGTNFITDYASKLWKDRIVRFGEALRMFDQACYMDKSLVGTGVTSLGIPKSTSHMDVTNTKSEGSGTVAERTHTPISNTDAVNFTFAASNFYQGDVTMDKEVVMTTAWDLMGQARYTVSQALAQDCDTAIATALQERTTVSNVIYGGSATTVATLATGDKFTTDLIPDAMQKIEANNFEPSLLFVGTKQIRELRKDSQFTNAAEYGSNEVIMKGEIGRYLGVKVIKTTNAPAYTSGTSDTNENALWSATGTCCIMTGTDRAGQNIAAGLVWKELPTISYEYEKRKNLHHVFYDQAFKTAVIQPGAICLIKVAND